MNEFYRNYAKELLQNILESYKSGNKKQAHSYALELKELNKTMFLSKKIIVK